MNKLHKQVFAPGSALRSMTPLHRGQRAGRAPTLGEEARQETSRDSDVDEISVWKASSTSTNLLYPGLF